MKDAGVSLAGRTALVTGAAKRLGRTMALALAQQGVRVVVHHNRSEADAAALCDDIRRSGGSAWQVQGDLSDAQQARRVFQDAVAQAGAVDILINNASIFEPDTIWEATEDSVLLNLRIHAMAPLILSREMAKQGSEKGRSGLYSSTKSPGSISLKNGQDEALDARPGFEGEKSNQEIFPPQSRPDLPFSEPEGVEGHIINVLDARVTVYDKEHASYHISKRVLATLTRMLALELAPKIAVNAIAPGLILPPAGQDESYLQGLVHTNPLKRHGEPEDVVDAVLFLLRSRFVTGQILYIDGGYHMKGHMYD